MNPEQGKTLPTVSLQWTKSTGGVRRLLGAIRYSLAGLRAALRHEAAFRQLSALAAVLLPLACLLNVSGVERALLVGAVLLALIVELLNSAIEAVVDRVSLDFHPLSGRAKDMGSAAQLIALVLVALLWGLVLL